MTTAAITSESLSATAPTIERSVPVDHDHDHVEVDDLTEGRAFVVGLLAGGVVMSALMFAIGLLAGLDAGVSAAVAPIPGVVAGLFFGMTAYLGLHIAREEHARRKA